MTCVHMGGAIVTIPDETENIGDVDLRTRAGREEEVRRQVQEFGGFTVFWVTDIALRAQAADRMITRGELISCGGGYPWCGYHLKEAA